MSIVHLSSYQQLTVQRYRPVQFANRNYLLTKAYEQAIADQNLQFMNRLSVGQLSAITADMGTLTAGKIILVSATHLYAIGLGFGTANQFLTWYGPRPTGDNLALCEDSSGANFPGIFYEKIDGTEFSLLTSGKALKNLTDITAIFGGFNLLKNSSFEDITGFLNNWTLTLGAGNITSSALDATEKKYGSQSAKFTQTVSGTDTYYSQQYLLRKPNTKYTLSGWVYVTSITAGAVSNRAMLIHDGAGAQATDLTLAAGHATGVWTRKQCTFQTGVAPLYVEARFYLPNGTVQWDGIQLEEGSIPSGYAPLVTEITPQSIGTAELANLGVDSTKLAALAVTTAKLANGAVDNSKLAALAVDTGNLINGAVDTNKLAALAVTTAKIADLNITDTKIATDAITTPKIAANAVTAAEIAAHTITAAEIAALTITAAEIAANTITAGKILGHTITAAEIAALTITAAEIAANTITAGKIASHTITAAEIAALTITAAEIAANTITAAKIAAATITATEIAASTITGAKIAALTIAAGNIAAGAISADKILANQIIAAKISQSLTNYSNLWPNPTSEIDPPGSYTPPNDGTDSEYDFRSNAGANPASYSGVWVREITRTVAGTTQMRHRVPASPGELYYFTNFHRWIATAGTPVAKVKINYLDKNSSLISSTSNISNTNPTGDTSWTITGALTGGAGAPQPAPADTAFVEFMLELVTGTSGTATIRWDALNAFKYIQSGDILDGSITPVKLVRTSAIYSSNSGSGPASGAWTTMNYEDSEKVSGLVTTGASWHYTVAGDGAGLYLVTACATFDWQPTLAGDGGYLGIKLVKAGVDIQTAWRWVSSAGTHTVQVSAMVQCSATQQMHIDVYQTNSTSEAVGMTTVSAENRICIVGPLDD